MAEAYLEQLALCSLSLSYMVLSPVTCVMAVVYLQYLTLQNRISCYIIFCLADYTWLSAIHHVTL